MARAQVEGGGGERIPRHAKSAKCAVVQHAVPRRIRFDFFGILARVRVYWNTLAVKFLLQFG